uniref:THAP domain-containing protein 9 n=1 Tax=Lygus hesperus TaxID=30085 RepID=A0A0A9YRJ5_LYGHE
MIVEVETDGNPIDVDTVAGCSSIGCPVASKTHPNVRIYKFPYKSPKRINSWLRIAGKTCIQPLRLCARHFDIYNRELIPKYPFWDLDPATQTYRPKFDPINPRCCVPGCSPPDDEDLSYHRFPLDKQAFKVWIQRIGWKQLELYEKGDVFRGFRVCSQHFTKNWFTINSSKERVLRPGAVPTLFLTSDNMKEKSNEEDASYEIALMESQNVEEESYVVSTSADTEESNFRPVNHKKRRDSQQGQQYPDRKKQKGAAEDICDLQTSSNKTEISFWIASPPISDRIEESDPHFVEEEWVVVDSKGLEVGSQLNNYNSGGVHHDAAESNFVQKTEESFQPDTEDLGSDGDRDESAGDPLEVQGSCNIIEESETCELWTESSQFVKQHRSDAFERDLLGSAFRLCNFDATKVEKLRSLTGKKKKALNELEELLVEHLEHVVSITGVEFLRKCFDHVVNSSSKKMQKQQQVVSEETKKFAVSLQSLSGTGYSMFSQITNLPHPSIVSWQWATNDTGYPGFNKHAFTKLSDKVKELGDNVFFVSLCVAEITIDKHVERNGSDLFGYVDLGCGRIRDDFISEATSVLMFHANGVTHDFAIPLGYCLIHYLSPTIRANLIRQYLLQLYSIGVKCNALVCDGSAMTYRTYKELGVLTEKISPQCGFFKHPANQAIYVYCYIDIEDAMMLIRNFLAENEFVFNQHKNKVRWSDVEQLDDFLHWDLRRKVSLSTNFEKTGEAIGELEMLQVQLKNDSRPFKRNSASALRCLYERYCHTIPKAGGSIEFLMKMESISDLFSGRNIFSKEQPAIRRSNTTVTLGSIKNHLIYLNSLTDLNDRELVNGSRRIPILYLILNLLSLEGYLKRTFFYEKKLRAKIVMTQSFTLSNMRESIKQLVSAAGGPLITASRFKDAYFNLFCGSNPPERLPKYLRSGKAPVTSQGAPSTISPLHIGLCVSESYEYKRLRVVYERFGDFLTDNVLHSWLESKGCPDCKSLVMNEIKEYDSDKISLISDVNKMLRVAETSLSCLGDEIPLSAVGNEFHRFTNSVLNEMTSFDGFKLHEHLFNSVEFGRISHFITLVKEVLTIFLRYRISFMVTQGKIIIEPKTRTTFSRRSWT